MLTNHLLQEGGLLKIKVFALSMYKKSPKLYRYIREFFQLPSERTLKHVLSSIPFETGINSVLFEHLRDEVQKMYEPDRFCTLIFDEMSLSSGLYYQKHKQRIMGFEDLGHLRRTEKMANHALVFMVRGIRRSWKQVAYYITLQPML